MTEQKSFSHKENQAFQYVTVSQCCVYLPMRAVTVDNSLAFTVHVYCNASSIMNTGLYNYNMYSKLFMC